MTSIKYTTIRINVSTDAPLDGSTKFTGTPATGVVDPVTGIISYNVVGPVGVFDLGEIIGIKNVALVLQGLTVENSSNPHLPGSIVQIQSPPIPNSITRERVFAFGLGGKSGLLTDTNYIVPVDHFIAINTGADDQGTPGPHVLQFSIAQVTDDLLNGLLAVRANSVKPPTQNLLPVRAASTAEVDLTTLNALDTIDGVVVATGDRVLLKVQDDATENGIYVIQDLAPGVRSSDMNADAEVRSGLTVFVSEGTINATSVWALDTVDSIQLGTTDLSFTQVGGVGSSDRVWMRHQFTPAGAPLEYIPLDGSTSAGTVITADSVRSFFPKRMRLLSIAVWNLGTQAPGNTTMGLHINNNVVADKEAPVVDMTGNDQRFIFDFSDPGLANVTTEVEFTAISFEPTLDPTGAVRMISYWEPLPPDPSP